MDWLQLYCFSGRAILSDDSCSALLDLGDMFCCVLQIGHVRLGWIHGETNMNKAASLGGSIHLMPGLGRMGMKKAASSGTSVLSGVIPYEEKDDVQRRN